MNLISTNRNGSTILTFTDDQWNGCPCDREMHDGNGGISKPGCTLPHLSFGLTQESELGNVLDSRVSKNYYLNYKNK